MSDFQVVKSRKSKNKKGNHAIKLDTPQGMTVSDYDVTDVTRKINEAMCTLRTAEFYSETKALVSSLDVEDIVCYGLGNFAECCIARYQLALLMLLREDVLQVTQENCYFYDPKSLQVEEEYLQNAGFNVIKENEEGKRSASRRTLFYMPHCGKSLYNNLLWANWTPEQMSRCVVIGNSFKNILDRNPSRKLEEACWYLYNISSYVTEVKLPENFQYTDIFNDTVIMTFPEYSLQEVTTHTWEHVQEPKYDDDDLEFVPNKSVVKIVSKRTIMLVKYGKSYVDIKEVMKPVHEQVRERIFTHGTDETSFLIGDLGDIIQKVKLWKRCLPRVEPFFAMKVNSLETVVRLPADMGLSFDCASKDEIRMLLELGVDPSRIIYANTFKQTAFLKYAADKDVSLMTFDCESELIKIKSVFPTAKLVLRIDIETNFEVKFPMGKKFGCPSLNVRQVLQTAKDLQLNVIGICFHVGSLVLEVTAFDTAIRQARKAFDIGLEMGFDMKLLDIGGGFPGAKICNMDTDITFEKMADTVNAALERYFHGIDVRVTAEPGRYFVASAFTLATNIVTKKISHSKNGTEEERVYIINDGVYGCFIEVIWNPGCFIPLHFKEDSPKLFPSTLWGPTCDIVDLVIEKYRLPDLEVGDWIYFKDMGAYTVAISSEFCSMPKATQYFVCDSEKWNKVYQQKM